MSKEVKGFNVLKQQTQPTKPKSHTQPSTHQPKPTNRTPSSHHQGGLEEPMASEWPHREGRTAFSFVLGTPGGAAAGLHALGLEPKHKLFLAFSAIQERTETILMEIRGCRTWLEAPCEGWRWWRCKSHRDAQDFSKGREGGRGTRHTFVGRRTR